MTCVVIWCFIIQTELKSSIKEDSMFLVGGAAAKLLFVGKQWWLMEVICYVWMHYFKILSGNHNSDFFSTKTRRARSPQSQGTRNSCQGQAHLIRHHEWHCKVRWSSRCFQLKCSWSSRCFQLKCSWSSRCFWLKCSWSSRCFWLKCSWSCLLGCYRSKPDVMWCSVVNISSWWSRLTDSVQVREFGARDEQPGFSGGRGEPGCQAADAQWTSQWEGDQSPSGQTQHQVIRLILNRLRNWTVGSSNHFHWRLNQTSWD